MTKEEIENIRKEINSIDNLRQLQDWKIQANEDMHNIQFQMREFKRKDNKRKQDELSRTNYYTIDDEGEKKYNKQRLAYDKRVELIQRIDRRIGEIRRQKENDYYHFYHAIARKKLDPQTENEIHREALKESGNE